MKSFEQLAASAYAAHGKELQALIGVSQRDWATLPPSEKACWIAAVKQVVAEVAAIH